jgi:hypothetical protein
MPERNRKHNFNLHELLMQLRVSAMELAATIVFFVWLFRALLHELGVR